MTLFDPDSFDDDVDSAAVAETDAVRDRIVVHFDGGSRGNPGPAGIGAVVTDPAGEPPALLASVSEYIGDTTNNVAEYRALIAGLEAARAFPARHIDVRGDSKLVIEQVRGAWKVKQAHLRPLVDAVRRLLEPYERVTLTQVPRAQNADADLLVNAALDAR